MIEFAARVIISIGIIWITQLLLAQFNIQQPARQVIFTIVINVAILFLLFGATLLPLH